MSLSQSTLTFSHSLRHEKRITDWGNEVRNHKPKQRKKDACTDCMPWWCTSGTWCVFQNFYLRSRNFVLIIGFFYNQYSSADITSHTLLFLTVPQGPPLTRHLLQLLTVLERRKVSRQSLRNQPDQLNDNGHTSVTLL